MASAYRIVPELAIVVSRLEGEVRVEEIAAARERLRADPLFQPSFDHILDLRAARAVVTSPDQVRVLAASSVFAPGSRRVIIAADDLLFGLSRMYEQFAGRLEQEIGVVRDGGEAARFLGLGVDDVEEALGQLSGGLSP